MKPRFVDGMKNITVEMGQDATFVCVVSEIHVRRNIYFLCDNLGLVRDTEWAGCRPTVKPYRR